MRQLFLHGSAVIASAIALASCGGGGGGGGGGAFFLPPVVAPAPTAPDTSTLVTVSGTVSYDAVPNPGGALIYESTSARPVRGATVEALDAASAVIASGITDATGKYAVTVPSNIQIVVRVKAQLAQSGSGASFDVSVRDNTQSEALYVLDSTPFSSGGAASTRDLRAASGWTGTGYGSQRVAAPFAILDTVYTAMEKVRSVAPDIAFPPLRVFWSVNNVPASGNRALGQIGTTSFSSGSSGRAIYVLGKENVDTDEYDASVIAHEWGHYYQSAFSRDDSPGGAHSAAERLDRRLAFSEGWGNAWSGIALARRNYTDSVATAQAQGVNLDLATGPTSTPGWYRENSVHAILWNLHQQVGFQPIHAALTGGFRATPAVTSIHPFAAAFNAASPANAGALTALLAAQNISAAPNDPFASAETNNGGIASVIPMYLNAIVGGAATTACVSNSAGAGNKLGSFAYLRVNAAAAGNRLISVTGPAAADPDFEVYSGRLLAFSDGLGVSEAATVALLAGDNVIVLNDYNNAGPSTCFSVTVQ